MNRAAGIIGFPGLAWRRLVRWLLAGALLVPLVGGAQTGSESASGSPDSTVATGSALSPSTDELRFEQMYPGESRTLFMDLANLESREILLDSLLDLPDHIELGLDTYRLSPGQFIRFPVTFTQASLDSQRVSISLPWRYSDTPGREILRISVISTPRIPVLVNPGKLTWKPVLRGRPFKRRLTVANRSTVPAYFSPPQLPPEVALQGLPEVLAGGDVAYIQFTWHPATNLSLDAVVNLPYRMLADSGRVAVHLEGLALPPVEFATDTLRLPNLVAGSRYRPILKAINHSGLPVTLVRDSVRARPVSVEAAVRLPAQFNLAPGQVREVAVNVALAEAGPFELHARYRILEQVEDIPAGEQRPVLVTVAGTVALPISAGADSITFGPQPVYFTTSRPLTLANRGHGTLTVSLLPASAFPGGAFSVPPLSFSILPGRSLEIPIYFRPTEMRPYADTLVVRFHTFGVPHELHIALRGTGADQPLGRVGRITDVVLDEDFEGWQWVADLTTVFLDPNHGITYRLDNPLADVFQVAIEDNQFRIKAIPNRYGSGAVILQATNTIGETAADTFRVTIRPINDLPRLVNPISDLVLFEDAYPRRIGRLSEIFVDADRTTDTVTTRYAIHNRGPGNGAILRKRGDELWLELAREWSGRASFVITATDPADTTVMAYDAFKVTVLPVNDPPLIAALDDLALDEDGSLILYWGPLLSDPDDPATALALSFHHAEGGRLPIDFISAAPLQTIIRPHANWSGTVPIAVLATDPGGQTGGNTFTLTVYPENDPPLPFRAAGPMTAQVDDRLRFSGHDTLLTFSWEASVNLDPEDAITYTWQLLDTSRQKVLLERSAGEDVEITVPLSQGGLYYWTVLGRDQTGLTASSDTLPLMLESTAPMDADGATPLRFSIGPNYPNPFNASTKIRYRIPRYAKVTITLFDATGRQVRQLVDRPRYAGKHTTTWDGRDSQGHLVASGPYVAELHAGGAVAHLKLVLLR